MIEVLGVLDKKSMRKLFVYQDSSSLNKLSIASARGRGKDELKNPSVSSRAGIAVFIASCIRPRLQNSRVFFFSKSVKISVKRGVRVLCAKRASLKTSLPSLALRFQPRSRPFVWLLSVLEYTKIWTVCKLSNCERPFTSYKLPGYLKQRDPRNDAG